MPEKIRIALIGDYDASVVAHQAIPHALALAATAAGFDVAADWVPTDEITSDADIPCHRN